jgi:pimeloyl-ACP methyl ester carboxylesterase
VPRRWPRREGVHVVSRLVLLLVLLLTAPSGVRAHGEQVVEGRMGSGARYAIHLPDGWNGEAVFYAHGFYDPALPLRVPGEDTPPALLAAADARFAALRAELLARGYAVAASSYSENGYNVKDASQCTQQLIGAFTARVRRPRRAWLVGESMGSLAGLMLVETLPQQVNGFLATCGPLGGSRAEIDYIAHGRVLFDAFFRGAVRGSFRDVPADLDFFGEVVPRAAAAMASNPTATFQLATLDQFQLPFTVDPATGESTLAQSMVEVLYLHVRGAPGFFDAARGSSFDNTSTVYSSPLLLPDALSVLNGPADQGGIDRFSADPQAVAYAGQYYTPGGALRVPVLTLHTAVDPVAPLWHEDLFESTVREAGAGALLARRTVARYGHCALETAEVVDAFEALVTWATGLEKGAPGPSAR